MTIKLLRNPRRDPPTRTCPSAYRGYCRNLTIAIKTKTFPRIVTVKKTKITSRPEGFSTRPAPSTATQSIHPAMCYECLPSGVPAIRCHGHCLRCIRQLWLTKPSRTDWPVSKRARTLSLMLTLIENGTVIVVVVATKEHRFWILCCFKKTAGWLVVGPSQSL